MAIVLTDEQQNVVDKLIKWSVDPNISFAALKGSAGTGKTTVLNTFLKSYKKTVVVSAPTHKAKTVTSIITGKPSATLQSLLGLRPDTSLPDFDIDNPLFSVHGDILIGNYALIVIDESSMINEHLYKLVCASAIDNKCKVLFVGDELQLPPVGEQIAVALNDTNHPIFELTTVIRQKGTNPLGEIFYMLRQDIINGTENTVNFLKRSKGTTNLDTYGDGYTVVDYNNSSELIAEKFKAYESSNNLRFISFTNKSVVAMNRWIRSQIFTDPFIVMTGEILMSYKTISQMIMNGKRRMYEEIIFNSEDYKVLHATPSTSEGVVGLQCVIQAVNMLNAPKKTVFIVQPSSIALFLRKHDELRDTAINSTAGNPKQIAWQNYYSFKNYFLLLGEVKSTNSKKIVPKDFDYGYGITVHKSQGSTYDHVIVNVKDILTNYNVNDRNKLLYVAASRASKSVLFLI